MELLTSWGGLHGLNMCFSSVCAVACWLSLCLDPQGLRAFGQGMQGVERCNGSVQTYTQLVYPILL